MCENENEEKSMCRQLFSEYGDAHAQAVRKRYDRSNGCDTEL